MEGAGDGLLSSRMPETHDRRNLKGSQILKYANSYLVGIPIDSRTNGAKAA